MTKGYISILQKKGENSYFLVLKTPFKFVLSTEDDFLSEQQKIMALTYLIIYQAEVNDIDEAERYLLSMLRAKGMYNENMIMFGQVEEAITVMSEFPSLFPANCFTNAGTVITPDYYRSEGERCFKLGQNYYYGIFNTEINKRKALHYFKKAVKKGYLQAHLFIAQIYFYDRHRHGRIRKAFKHLVMSLQAGIYDAYALMAFIYNHNRDEVKADQCWECYFSLDHYSFLEEIPFNCFMYVQYCFYERKEIRYLDFILRYKESVIQNMDNMTEYMRENSSDREFMEFCEFCEETKKLLNSTRK